MSQDHEMQAMASVDALGTTVGPSAFAVPTVEANHEAEALATEKKDKKSKDKSSRRHSDSASGIEPRSIRGDTHRRPSGNDSGIVASVAPPIESAEIDLPPSATAPAAVPNSKSPPLSAKKDKVKKEKVHKSAADDKSPILNRRARIAAGADNATSEAETDMPLINRRARVQSVFEGTNRPSRGPSPSRRTGSGGKGKPRSDGEETPFIGTDEGETGKRRRKSSEKKSKGGAEGQISEANIEEEFSSSGSDSDSSLATFDPNDISALKKRLEKVQTHDPRIIYEPQVDRIPMWVHRWSDMKYFTDIQHRAANNPLDTITGAVIRELTSDLHKVDMFISEIRSGREGGFGEQSSGHFEEPETIEELEKAQDSPKHSHKKPPPDRWKWPGAALAHTLKLRDQLAQILEQAKESIPVGAAPAEGKEGLQFDGLPRANNSSFESILFRATMEELFAGDKVRHNVPGQRNLRIENSLSKIPIIHKEFLIDDDGPRMHLDVLNFPDMLTPPVGREGPSRVRRSITVNINYIRLQAHERFTKEHEAASEFLDAYERYRLLASNMMSGVKSRRFYEQLLHSIEHENPPHPYLAVVQELHARTSEMETGCLKGMLKAWKDICRARQEQGTAYTHLEFSLTKTGESEATTFSERTDNVLDFSPMVSDIDIDGSPTQANQIFCVTLQSQLSASQPSQPVGSTDKRPLNTVFTAVFKECFELLTNHDPVKFSAIITDAKGTVIAAVDIPPSLSHTQHLLDFKTQIQYASPTGTRSVCGVISLSTTWTTVAGLTIEDIEKRFLRGDMDPMDPRNEAMVRILGKYYIEQAAAKQAETKDNAVTTNKTAALSERAQGRLRAVWESIQPEELNADEDSILNNETYKLTNMTPKMRLDVRQTALNRRWRITKGEILAADAVETKLLTSVIPADEVNTKRLIRDLSREEELRQREAAKEVVAIKKGNGISEWQQRIRNMKMTQARKKKLKDHEIQAKILILPAIPTPKRLIDKFFRWFVPRSPLNPVREDRLDMEVIRARKQGQESAIIVHVLKVSNLPSRDGSEGGLEPFIVCDFIGCEAQTRIESGTSPAFFESMKLDFTPSDFEDSTLSLIDDDVCISFYDKVQVSLPPATIPQSTTAYVTHYRLERRLLGTIKIPFYTLYDSATASMEGQFDITTPRAISGYQRPTLTPSAHLFISLYPAVSRNDDDALTTEEILTRLFSQPLNSTIYMLYTRALQWRTQCQGLISGVLAANPLAHRRETEPFVNNSKGDLNFICRYLTADGIKPPKTVTHAGEAIRYVSLIPFVVDMISWNDAKDVWSTLAEFLEMGAGDYEELAVLLCMFLRHLDPEEQTFLVLGMGSIFRQATFVLHSHKGTVNLIDPRTGSIYNIENPKCGLEEVAMVVSHDQVWANIQLSGSPHRMVWNFSDRRYWLPMLDEEAQQHMVTIPSVQRPTLDYAAIKARQESDLEEQIRREVKRSLRAWRKDKQPTYQQRVGTILREVLVKFEEERCLSANVAKSAVTDEHTRAIGEFSAKYEAVGVPVNVGYKDETFKELMHLLNETRVHEIGTDNAVFGLAVYVKAYSGTVISIWVYLLGLVPLDPAQRL